MDTHNPDFDGNINASQKDGSGIVGGVNFKDGHTEIMPQITWEYMNELRVWVLSHFPNQGWCDYTDWSLGYSFRETDGEGGMKSRNDKPLSVDNWLVGLSATGQDTGTYEWTQQMTERTFCGDAQTPNGIWDPENKYCFVPTDDQFKCMTGQIYGWMFDFATKTCVDAGWYHPAPTPSGNPATPAPTPTSSSKPKPTTNPSTTTNPGTKKAVKRVFVGKHKGFTARIALWQRDGVWSKADVKAGKKKAKAVALKKWRRAHALAA